MVYYTGLARVARKTGYPVVEVDGWKSRGHDHMLGCKTIIAHHTATSRDAEGDYPSLNVVRDGRSGLPGPLAQYGIGRSGTIYVIAAGVSWHAGRVRNEREDNWHAIGIEAENDGIGEPWPTSQLDSYVRLCRALVDEFGIRVIDVKGHKEVAVPEGRKIDPAFETPNLSMVQFRSRVRNADLSQAPDQPDAPGTGPWPEAFLPITDEHTAESHAAWVKLLTDVGHTNAGNDLTRAMQNWLRKLTDPNTGRPYYEGRIDSDFGPMTTRALQEFLKDKGLYAGRIDGDRGPMTIRAEIKYLNEQAELY